MKLNMKSLCFLEQSKPVFRDNLVSFCLHAVFPPVLWRWAQVWELGWCFPRGAQFPSGKLWFGALVVLLAAL